jgi:hypothetical protein
MRATGYGWLALALLVLVQWLFFHQFVRREVVGRYPPFDDQAVYLNLSYHLHEDMLTRGPLPALWQAVRHSIPNGLLLHVQAALLFLVTGPGREAALTIPFLYLVLFQCALADTLRWLTGRWTAALFGVGLLLSARIIATPVGGLFDFRIDFTACCQFGIFLCLVVRSGGFLLRRWSLLAGVAACLLGLTRFLSCIYLAGILGPLLAAFAALAWWRRHDAAARQLFVQRLINLSLVCLLLAAAVLPVLSHRARLIWKYYNHIPGGDLTLRLQEAGITTLTDSLLFYPNSLLWHQTGIPFLVLGLTALGVVVGARLGRAPGTSAGTGAVVPGWSVGAFALLALAVPLAVLTCTPSKSPVVGSILVPPLVWALLLPLARLWPRAAGRAGGWVTRGLALAALACGLCVYAGELCVRLPQGSARPDGKQIAALHDTLIREAERRRFTRPLVCADVINDFLGTDAINVVSAERFGQVADFGQAPNTWVMQEPTVAQLEAMAEASQFVVVSDAVLAPASCLIPYNRHMDALRPALRAWCEQHLSLLGSYALVDRQLLLYGQPRATVRGGTADGWVTSNGLWLRGVGRDLQSFPTVTLRGVWSGRWHRAVPKVRVLCPGFGDGEAASARMEVSAHRYEITVKVNPSLLAANPDPELHLLFDRFFVPRDRGINPDPRQLVVFLPDQVVLSR